MICLDRSAMKLSFSVLAGLLLQVVPVAGQDFVWARQMGGTGFPQSSGVALDGSGNVYTTGSFRGAADFDPGRWGLQPDLCRWAGLGNAGHLRGEVQGQVQHRARRRVGR